MTQPSRDSIAAAFAERFGTPPAAIVRAPGRVNLIGEHTDYSHLPVLPIAIDRALLIAAAPTDDGILEAHSTAFPTPIRLNRADIHTDPASPWSAYLAGLLRELPTAAPGRGARILVDGDLPHGGGLSSSSALTCGVLAALNSAWSLGLTDEEIATTAAAAERHTGVDTGGMDQQAIVFAQAGHALRIDFEPPARRQVAIPQGLRFVVAYSGEPAAKSENARDTYNERVVGARIAAAMLADQIGVDISPALRLAEVADIDVVDILADDLPERVSAQEVAHGASVDVERLVRLTAGRFDHTAKVLVRRVALHVLSEAQRVEAATAALEAGELQHFGQLLNDSHNSLREDFRCSTPALDRVCAAMRKAGAYGARLTGAGFGGYGLAAVAPERLQAVIEAATTATGGPAFEVHAADGLRLI